MLFNFQITISFSNVNVAYSGLVNKISDTIDNVAPIKKIKIKKNTEDWFDNKIAEVIKTREKDLKKVKNQSLKYTIIFILRQNIILRNQLNKGKLNCLIQN